MHDLIRGDVTVHTSTLDDKVLYKSADALPTYHRQWQHRRRSPDGDFACDSRRRVAAVAAVALCCTARSAGTLRGEFAHLPLLLKPTGGGKLNKRDGDKMEFPVFPLQNGRRRRRGLIARLPRIVF